MASPDPRAPYQLIADHIRSEIATGQLSPGDPIPAVRRLAEQHHVAPNTAQQALRLLQRDGLIVTTVGKASVVADGAADKVPLSLEQLAVAIQELNQRVVAVETELRRNSHIHSTTGSGQPQQVEKPR